VSNGVSTFTGNIEIEQGAHIQGGIHVLKPDFNNDEHRTPRVVIGAESVVEGTLLFDREVKLLVSDTAKIGPVEGATVQLFAGNDKNHLIEMPTAEGAEATDAAGNEAGAATADKPAAGAAGPKPAGDKSAASAAQKP